MYGISPVGIVDEHGAINGYADATGMFLPMITTLNCAKVTDTFRRLLNVDMETFDALALSAAPGAGGVVLVPYLDGERCPDLPDACGALHGLRSDVAPAQLARAAVEAVILNVLEGGEHLARHGLADHGKLIVTGGASRSNACRQILADLGGRPVYTCELDETAAAGACVQAAAALTGKSTAEIAGQWRPEYRLVAEPDTRSGAWAEDVRQAYRRACASPRVRRHHSGVIIIMSTLPVNTPARRIRLPAESGIACVLLVVLLAGALASPHFFTLSNLSVLLLNGAVIGFLCLGQSFVLFTGGIDLS